MMTITSTTFDQTAAMEDRFQLATYKKMPIAAERGEGCWIYASNGEKYLDLYGGHAVTATGHCHPHVVEAIRRQAGELLFYSNLVYSEVRALAAQKLVGIAPKNITKAFFCNSGTEANENAMRLARMATGRLKVISFSGGFHGRTADSISATFLGKYHELGRPNVPHHLQAEFGDIKSVAAVADKTVAAVMLEPIQSMAGVRTTKPEFFRELRELCNSLGMMLIYDEVQTGIGRTGEWLFAGSEAGGGVVPDVITLAKALGSGVPVGACLTTGSIATRIRENDLGTTFGGGMLAMAAVTATLEAIEHDSMLTNVRMVEAYLRARLADFPSIVAVHGMGLLLGIEFEDPAGPIHEGLLEKRIITGTSSNPNVLRLLPPLCVTTDEVEQFVEALTTVLMQLEEAPESDMGP
jgi:acetylornithine aminotransferase/acetylornithine/N-succinyldiaminopimelate aminotransferase